MKRILIFWFGGEVRVALKSRNAYPFLRDILVEKGTHI